MLKKRHFFWWGLLLLVLIGIGWGTYLFQKPRSSAADVDTAVKINADSLYHQYESDETGSDKKYLGKVIEVTGKISSIQHSGESEVWILSTASPAGGINCQLFPGEEKNNAGARPGDQVTVKGKCTGFLADVNLSDCAVRK